MIKRVKTKVIAVLTAVLMVFAMAPLSMGLAYADDNNADITAQTETAAPDEAVVIAAADESATIFPAPLLAKMTSKGKTALVIKWSRYDGAEGYDVFLTKCSKNKWKRVKTVKGNAATRSFTKKKLSPKSRYKAYVKAWVMKDGKKKYIAASPKIYAYTTGGSKKYTNPKSVTVKVTDVTLGAGDIYTIKASVTKLKEGKKLFSNSSLPKLRYLSSDQNVATVSDKGVITATAGGTCKVCVYAVNGVRKDITVTVTLEARQPLSYPNTIKDLSPYYKSTTNCQVGNSAIKSLTNSLTAGLTTDKAKATAVFNYVRDQISYSFYYDTQYGAVGTLRAKEGNEVDQAHLLVALLRTAGIASRYHHSTCTFSDGSTRGHVWVECVIDNTWIALDPTAATNSFGYITNWDTTSFMHQGYYASLPF